MPPPPVPVRDAATVMLVRDAPDGPEVFMLRRSLTSAFVGGAYVFPGGAVDATDREVACAGRSDAEASEVLGIESGGLAFWVAAIRECFEEAGVLLALGDDGELVSFNDPAVADRFNRHRDRLNAGEMTLVALCEEEGLVLDVSAIHYFAHWITPTGAPRRYDTRFFVAAAPPNQEPLHDDREVIANLWIRPADALERNAAGSYELIEPTIRTLEAVARFTASADLLAAARAMGEAPALVPRMGRTNDGVRIPLPGDRP